MLQILLFQLLRIVLIPIFLLMLILMRLSILMQPMTISCCPYPRLVWPNPLHTDMVKHVQQRSKILKCYIKCKFVPAVANLCNNMMDLNRINCITQRWPHLFSVRFFPTLFLLAHLAHVATSSVCIHPDDWH